MVASVPSRHPVKPRPIAAPIRMFALLLGVRAPTPEQWQRLGDGLTAGDEPMDRLVEWMSQAGKQNSRPLFNRALENGIASVPDAPAPLREFFAEFEPIPGWVDPEKIRRGQRALSRGGADGVYIARDVSFLGGYQFAAFNQTLLRTGVLKKGSNKRFAETLQWSIDIMADGGLDRLGVGYQSTIRVRLIHEFVRRYVAAMEDWRSEVWGLPVNQTDMAATMVGALIAPPIAGIGMGMVLHPAELDAIAHVTRYVGWLMGIDDEWLPRSFRDSVRILSHTLGALPGPDETTKQLAVPMADDPLAWHYRSLPGLRRRLAQAQHLSVTSGFLGPRTMRALGLPAYVPPWYPLLRMPANLVRSAVALAVPGGIRRAAARGRREQQDLLRTMLGDDDAAIGASATRVDSVA